MHYIVSDNLEIIIFELKMEDHMSNNIGRGIVKDDRRV